MRHNNSGLNDIIYLFKEKEMCERREKEKKDKDSMKAYDVVHSSIQIDKSLIRVAKSIKALNESNGRNEMRKSMLPTEKKNKKRKMIRDKCYVSFPEQFNDCDWMSGLQKQKSLQRKIATKKQQENKLALVYCTEFMYRNVNEMNGKVLLRCILNLCHMRISFDGITNHETHWRPLDYRTKERKYKNILANDFYKLIKARQSELQCAYQKVISENQNHSKLYLVDFNCTSVSQYSSLYQKILKRTQKINQLELRTEAKNSLTKVNDFFLNKFHFVKSKDDLKRRIKGEYVSMPMLSLLYLKNTTSDNTILYQKKQNANLNLLQYDTTTSLSIINSKKFKQKTTDILSSISSSLKSLNVNKKPFDLQSTLNKIPISKEYLSMPFISLSKMVLKKRKYNEITDSNGLIFYLIKPLFAKYLKKKNSELLIDIRENVDVIFDLDSCGIILNIEDLVDEYDLSSYTKTFDIINKNYLKFASFFIIITHFKLSKKHCRTVVTTETGQENKIKQKVEEYLFSRFDQIIHSESIRLKFIISYIRSINELHEQIINIINEIRLNKEEQYSVLQLLSPSPSSSSSSSSSSSYWSIMQELLKQPLLQEVITYNHHRIGN